MDVFNTYLLVLGLLLAIGALLSGLAHRSVLSLAILFLGAGVLLGRQGFGIIEPAAGSEFVARVTELTLLVILFFDGLEVERGVLRKGWHVPIRSLLIAMPLTAGLIALAAYLLVGLSWAESLLLGALLSPTDPVLTSSVVTNAKIPARIRNSLNLESGFNDGLALPAVIIFATALQHGASSSWWEYLIRDLGVGTVVGFVGAWAAVSVLGLFRGRLALVPHYQGLYAFAVALSLYGIAVKLDGNGFIAVYLAGIVMASRQGKQVAAYSRFSRELGEVLKLATFVIFGSLLLFDQLFEYGAAGLAFAALVLFAARTAALLPSLLGTKLDWPERWFMAWFGPKGVACIAYSLLVLNRGVPGAEHIFNLTALVVTSSIILHGISDTPLADWFGSQRTARPGD